MDRLARKRNEFPPRLRPFHDFNLDLMAGGEPRGKLPQDSPPARDTLN